jgi:hypothetical protein
MTRHPLWSDRPASALKRLRVTDPRGLTMLEAAGRAGLSLSAYHNAEARGLGSFDLWVRIAASFGVSVEAIRPTRAPSIDAQLSLQWASSSS